MRIDAHQHFWSIARGDYGWLTPALSPIYRDYLPKDLHGLLEQHHIDRTILVQAAPTEAETQFLLTLANDAPFVAGVVGWIDLSAKDAPSRIERLARDPALKGLRPMLQDLPQDDWLLDPQLDPAFESMLDCGLRFDALIKPRHLPILDRFLDRYPALPLVIDHAAKPAIAADQFDDWSRAIRRIGAHGDVRCKLSGLLTEADDRVSIEDLRPYVEVLLDAFGPRRLMWGSDWPVLNLAADYSCWLRMSEELIVSRPAEEQRWIMGLTAAEFYGVEA